MDRETYNQKLVNLINEFTAYLTSCGFVGDDDKRELIDILRELSTIQGDINSLLSQYGFLYERVSWLLQKYNMEYSTREKLRYRRWAECYTYYLSQDHKDGQSKALVEADILYRQLQDDRDHYFHLVQYLERTMGLVVSRKPLLEQISNNLRADLRNEAATVRG